MVIEVVVMYEGLELVRVPWEQKHSLRRNGVLAVAISHAKQPSTTLRKKRYQLVYEYDYYVLVWDETSCYLGGYNDDLYWFDFAEPWLPYGKGFVHRFPFVMPDRSIVFEGVQVPAEMYAQAKSIFTDVTGEMG